MADAPDSKSGARKGVWVRVPPSVFFISIISSKEYPTVYNKLELLSNRPKHPQLFEK
jgi:hypothetical protein